MRHILDTLPVRHGLPVLLLLTTPVLVAAAAGESHQHIREVARAHVLARAAQLPGEIEVTVSRLDPRLRLEPCDVPLESYDSPNGLRPGRNVVGVRCNGRHPWKLYVTVEIVTLQPVVVAARPLARGQTVSAADLRIEHRDTARLHQAFYTDTGDLIGQRARRQVAAGRILHPGLLERRRLVRRGGTVQILVERGALKVRMQGKALQNGALGDRVRVRNRASGREITGEVIAAGVVKVAH